MGPRASRGASGPHDLARPSWENKFCDFVDCEPNFMEYELQKIASEDGSRNRFSHAI